MFFRLASLFVLAAVLLVVPACSGGGTAVNNDPDFQAVWGSARTKPQSSPSDAALRERWGQ